MNNLIEDPRKHVATQISEMDNAALLSELERVLAVTAETIAYLGQIWRELDRRGIDLTPYRQGMGQYLPLVASGQLAPDAIVKFSGKMMLLRAVQSLPVPEQTRLAAGAKVDVVSLDPEGEIAIHQVEASSLTGDQIKILFDAGRIRSVEEQSNMLRSMMTIRKRKKLPSARNYRISIDREKKSVRIGKMQIPASDLIAALKEAGLI